MTDQSPQESHQKIYLADYQPPAYLVDEVHLTFRLSPDETRVISRIRFRPNPDSTDRRFFLHGEDLRLIWSKIDGEEMVPEVTGKGLTVEVPDAPFTWEAEVEIDPEANTRLEGLYLTNGIFCTQCEAEGFRRITFYPDRPDVMAPFTVRIEGEAPVLLSNGNQVASGEGWAEWHDPWPKPCYLFALVAGELNALEDRFTTMSGREVTLRLWTRPGDEHKRDWAMQSLKRAMRWDEETYGREYDLDIFQIVAVSDFNMGAMENKALNIFNTSAVLASPDTATDANYARIEGIVAHEYFHNWTGNRITCRDWFQLSLKEGLTVFRDQSFSADMRSAGVNRIEDVLALRGRQFREDNGPLAHQVQPDSFVEINNFYTATIYEKGAEVIRMLKTLVGPEGYRAALDLYFTRHDGQACTIDDWLKVFEDATGRDLTQFKRWYKQAGTPRLKVTDEWKDDVYTLHFRQHLPQTQAGTGTLPMVIPVAVGLIGPDGREVVGTRVLEVTEPRQSFRIRGLTARPVPSILRGFSAPVILQHDTSPEDRAFLLAHDTDPFNRWEAGRALAKEVLVAMVQDREAPLALYLDALAAMARDDTADPAFRALALRLPGQDDIAQTLSDAGFTPDPDAIHAAHEALAQKIAEHLRDSLPGLAASMVVDAPYAPDAEQSGKRALALELLKLTTRLDGGAAAAAAFADADNMTRSLGALGCLLDAGAGAEALAAFEARWSDDAQVMDKWFAMQVAHATPETAAEVAARLTAHPAFILTNPNRFRAVFATLAAHPAGFHRADGSGYRLLADWILRLDGKNPQIAARMCSAFETWGRYDGDRQSMMRDQLARILRTPGLSSDTEEMVARILGR
ncbi:MAG: aminopeptidase N [Rhodobacterales bacterium]|nr:MAG: aminopeptidase N [Rhodobacterales bacterium]